MTKIEGVPDGYELVRFGTPKRGEAFVVTCSGGVGHAPHDFHGGGYAIVRKIEPPEPIEPPEGYRLIEDGVVVGGDLCFTAGWRDSERVGDCIEYLLKNGFAKAYARKIEPQYRPMTLAEFIAAWRQRSFCPLVNEDGNIEGIKQVIIDDCREDEEVIELQYIGWQSLDEMTNYQFASDETFLRVEA